MTDKGRTRNDVEINHLNVIFTPNPFFPETTLKFQPYMEPTLGMDRLTNIKGYGRLVSSLVDMQRLRNWLH